MTVPASAYIDWQTAISNLAATAVTVAETLNLATYAGTALNILRAGPNTTRVYVRARCQAVTAAATSPVVQIWSGRYIGETFPRTFAELVGTDLWRVDQDAATGGGLTLTVAATPGTTNMVQQTRSSVLYHWTDWATNDGQGYDLKGGNLVILAHTTAASITGTGIIGEVGFLN